MKSIKLSEEGALMRLSTNLAFEDIYHSVIVLANPASQLKDSAAPEDIKRKVIRADQLIEYIKGLNKEYKHKTENLGIGLFRSGLKHGLSVEADMRWISLSAMVSSLVIRKLL
jgi:hypothetical protein